jgi:hypothetical protein
MRAQCEKKRNCAEQSSLAQYHRGAAPMPAFSPATLFSPRAEKYFLVEILVIGDRLTHALGVQTVSSRGQRTRGGQLHVPLSYFQKYFRTKVLSKYESIYLYSTCTLYCTCTVVHISKFYIRTTIHELAYTYTFIWPTVTTNVQYHTSEGSFLSVFCTSGRKYRYGSIDTFVLSYTVRVLYSSNNLSIYQTFEGIIRRY